MRNWPTYIALGDSLSTGEGDYGADWRPVGWARRLGHILDAMSGPCKVHDLALAGATMYELLWQVRPAINRLRQWQKPGEPALASITIGMNDLGIGLFEEARFARHLGLVVGALQKAGATVMLMTFPDITTAYPPPPEDADEEEWLQLNELYAQAIRYLGDVVWDVAAKRQALCLDLWGMHVERDMLSFDRFHPSPEGHKMIAWKAADLLLKA